MENRDMNGNSLEQMAIAADIMKKLGVPGVHILRFNKTGEIFTCDEAKGGYVFENNMADSRVIEYQQRLGRTVFAIIDGTYDITNGEVTKRERMRSYLVVSKNDRDLAHQNIIKGRPLLEGILYPIKDNGYKVRAFVISDVAMKLCNIGICEKGGTLVRAY